MKNIFLVAALLISLNSISQKKECNYGQVYTGSFYILSQTEPGDTCFIKRTANSQNEWIPNKINKTFDVIWVNKCTYILRNKNLRVKKKYHPSDIVSKIIETTPNYYKVKAWAPGGKKMDFTIYILK
jgi:hypothetical protein